MISLWKLVLNCTVTSILYMWLADSNPSSRDYWLADSNPSSRDYRVGIELLDSHIYMKYSAFCRHFGYLAFSHWAHSFN
ncbi:hypothetical protein T02_10968 [Trichinella nativa]|uniref:Uncharacterized protein n=1 Tax=Trichinella nativa TaxID=6335 RepID=A0A0V1KZ85_9BILA|nr:hypothetical protein T02_4193 [Trichinella nativa]KRZ52621.1 hypothetical protein T02_10968 [Trichinella nativa]